MKLRISLHARYLGMLATLGLVPAACETVATSEIPCTSSEAVVANGQETGFETCSEGHLHRPNAVACASTLPRADMCTSSSVENDCSTDADCTDSPNGYCANDGQADWCSCRYGCVNDSDCEAGQLCMCGEPVGHCATATCATDDDCEGDLLCVAYTTEPGCGSMAFTCQSEDDECASDNDCPDSQQCTLALGKLTCEEIACAIGRPFLVEGRERLAAPATRRDWRSELMPRVDHLAPALRATLAERWTEIGLMEHASIAAFARFALQLLAQGAPAALVDATHEAMRDETQHAQLCFALATAYAGRDVGPGRLAIDGALDEPEPVAIMRMVVREGCIGETIAAVEAAEAALHAGDPVIREVLEQIARDEQRHSELAWRYVAWALADDDGSLAAVVRDEIAAASIPQAYCVTAEDRALLAHGLVTDPVRSELRRQALRDIIGPCSAALLASQMADIAPDTDTWVDEATDPA